MLQEPHCQIDCSVRPSVLIDKRAGDTRRYLSLLCLFLVSSMYPVSSPAWDFKCLTLSLLQLVQPEVQI